MKAHFIIISTILIASILVSCNSLQEIENDESASKIESSAEYSEESQPSGGFTLSASVIKYSADQKVANTSVKAEVSSHIAEKKVAPAERIYKKSASEQIELTFRKTSEKTISQETLYIDKYYSRDNDYLYLFDNNTGAYLGHEYLKRTFGETVCFEKEDYQERAVALVSEFINVNQYEISYEEFNKDGTGEIASYACVYKKPLNGIATTESVMCAVYVDGSTSLGIQNIGRFDNIVAPEIDFDELTQCAIEKAGNLLTDPPEGWRVVHDSIKTYDYLYHVNSSGKLELHFSFWYDLLPIDSEESDPHPWHNGMRMVIIFD